MMTSRSRYSLGVLAIVIAALTSAAAGEETPPPPYFVLPANLAVTRNEYRTYQSLDLALADFVVARHHREGQDVHDAWLKGRAGIVEIVEKSRPRSIELVPPGETPETIARNEPAPDFVPYPGMKVTWWDGDEKQHCDARNAVFPDVIIAGPPAIQMKFTGPAHRRVRARAAARLRGRAEARRLGRRLDREGQPDPRAIRQATPFLSTL
jgi:hypothetical protein